MPDRAEITLDQVLADPTVLSGVPRETIARLVGLLLAALTVDNHRAEAAPQGDRLLTVDQAAEKLAVPHGWLYKRKGLGLAVKLGDGTLRFSSAAIDAFIAAHRTAPEAPESAVATKLK